VGIPQETAGGLGLIAMRERAEILQGTLELRRPAQGGTLVIFEMPVAGTAVA
jgi:nitrate/nitrite-specific signal transduction histidine kinase